MTLQLGVITATGWAALRPLWQALGWSEEEAAPAETWYLQPDASVTDRVLLVHARAEFIIARLMEEGVPPERAVAAWRDQAEAMLSRFKVYRRNACMVDIHSLTSAEAVEALCQRSGLALPESLPDWQPAEAPAAEYLLIASQLLRQHPELGVLLAQLEACTLPLGDGCLQPPEIDASLVLARLTRTEEENKRLAEQLAASQVKFDDQQRHMETLRTELTQRDQKFQALVQESRVQAQREQALKGSLQTLEREKEQLAGELAKAKEKLTSMSEGSQRSTANLTELRRQQESLAKQHKTLVSEHDALKKEQDALREERDALQQRCAAQAEATDAAKAEASRQQAELTELQEGSRRLLAQLQSVQEAFEAKVAEGQRLKTAIEEQRQSQEHALAVANQKSQQLHEELNRLKSSVTWKVGAPVRALGKPFRSSEADKGKFDHQARQIEASPYFDAQWYRTAYPDVAEHGMDPAYHYLMFGADERRNPSERFDTEWYLKTNPDVAAGGLNPLIHFLNHGQAEGRSPSPGEKAALPSPGEAN